MKIADLKSHVTYFSEELQHKAKHEEDLVVGGKITSILSPVSEEYPMYVLTLDDLVGTSHVMVPDAMYDAYLEEFKIGNTVFMEGFANVITRTVKKEIKKDVTIFAYSMKDITKVGDTKS